MPELDAPKTRLTRKQKAFADHIIQNPKQSATQAALEAYNIKGKRHTAETIASENLRKPEIVSYLAHHNNLVENTILNTINDYKDSEKVSQRTLAVETSKWVHDKIHGKAVQQVQTTSKHIGITLNLSSDATIEEVPKDVLEQLQNAKT